MPAKQPPDFVGYFVWEDDNTPVTDFIGAYKKTRQNFINNTTDTIYYGQRELDIKFVDDKPEVYKLAGSDKIVKPLEVNKINGKWYGEFKIKREGLLPSIDNILGTPSKGHKG